MEIWQAVALPILLFIAWYYTATTTRMRFPTLRDKAIVLLIAHPDDEAMFFAPTVIGLTQPELGNHLKILCLSNGNADGLGTIREKEIKASALELGLRSAEDVLVLNEPRFPDSMKQEWKASDISELLNVHFLKSSNTGKRKQAVAVNDGSVSATIDVLITFDRSGVSSHPNHCSLFHGAVAWIQGWTKGKHSKASPVALYTLTSINVLRKYAGLIDVPWTLLSSVLGSISAKQRSLPNRPMFLSDVWGYMSARRAMTNAHKSQMVWFRWGWITIGRYMYVNDLKKVHVQ